MAMTSQLISKIPFQLRIIQKNSLMKLIQKWIQTLNVNSFLHHMGFKFYPAFVAALESNFLSNSIKYTILKRFQLLVRQKSDEELFSLSEDIKSTYTLLNINSVLKENTYFYYLCVVITKLVSNFLEETFGDINVNLQLESELFIIVVFVLIGLQVTRKAYHVNLKKVIHQKAMLKYYPRSLARIEHIDSYLQKPSSNKLTPCRPIKKLAKDRKATNVSCKQSLSEVPLEVFRQTLRDHLHVKPLPKLQKKKLKGSDFDYNADRYEAQQKGDENKYMFLRQHKLDSKPNKDFINSNQNSSAFDHCLFRNIQNKFQAHRNVKIAYRAQVLLSYEKMKGMKPTSSAFQTPVQQKQNTDKDRSKKNWDHVISQIRQSIVETHRITGYNRSVEELWDSRHPQKTNGLSHNRASQVLLPKRVSTVQEQQEGLFHAHNTNFASGWIHEKQQALPPSKSLFPTSKTYASKNIRKDRHQFDEKCVRRQHEAHASMFNITANTFITKTR